MNCIATIRYAFTSNIYLKSRFVPILMLKFTILSFILSSCTVLPLSDDDPPDNVLELLIDNQSSTELYERRQRSSGQETFILIPDSIPTPIWSVGYNGESVPQIEDIFSNENSENGSFIYRRINGSMVEALRWTDRNLDWEFVTDEFHEFSYILVVTDDMLE